MHLSLSRRIVAVLASTLLVSAASTVMTAPYAMAAPAPAAASSHTLTVEQLRAVQADMRSFDTLQVDFTQSKMTGLRGRSAFHREGKAIFLKPDLFKWMLETPSQEYKIYDGKNFYDYLPSAKSASRYSPSGPQAYQLRQMIDMVLKFDTLLKHYDFVHAEQTGAVISVTLKPKSQSEIKTVDLNLDTKQSFVSMLKMTLTDGTVLTHEFRNPTHKPMPESSFDLPKGVKVTDSN